ncbi:FixH family protein [Evansella sp. LMS18]|uniref:FixH family protein n=1 Tax=Evansella sp. LMS18 TaxID=2924033 RepID=UPI0020D0A1A4|nr:FixH family protein [Evansella sp. LMS18]UTR08901.1 FixH family protein [Evansella sp. LMS18]
MEKIRKSAGKLLLFTLLLVLAACNSSALEVSVIEQPVYEKGEYGVITFEVLESGQPVSGLEISALFEMNRMDHGHIEAVFTDSGDGVYTGEAAFAMSGEWIASVTASEGGNEIWTETVIFEVGEGNEH